MSTPELPGQSRPDRRDTWQHVCRADTECVNGLHGRPTLVERPNSLCDFDVEDERDRRGKRRRRKRSHSALQREGCMGRVERAVAGLGRDLALLQVERRRAFRSGRGSGRRSADPPGSPSLVDLRADTLVEQMLDAIERAVAVITDTEHAAMPEPYNAGKGLVIVAAHLEVLVAAPPSEHMQWTDDGTWDHVVYDGPQLALVLADLHRRARGLLGVTEGRDRMPVPCPRCEAHELGRQHGRTIVDCNSCGSSWTEQDYRRLTLVLADDLAATDRPKPRERHLSRSYATQPEATKGRRL